MCTSIRKEKLQKRKDAATDQGGFRVLLQRSSLRYGHHHEQQRAVHRHGLWFRSSAFSGVSDFVAPAQISHVTFRSLLTTHKKVHLFLLLSLLTLF